MEDHTKSTKQKTIYIEGMHCPSCELLIEKKLLKKSNVVTADASLKGSCVNLNIEADSYLDLEELNKEFDSLGYKFHKHPQQKEEKKGLLYADDHGNARVNWARVNVYLRVLGLLLGIFIIFYFIEKLQLGRYVSIDQGSSVFAFFLLGLVAGVSSCAALVGGLLLSMTKKWHEMYIDSDSGFVRARPHLMFHAGRLVSFFILGGALGLIGQAISLSNTLFYAFIVIAVSVVMFITALQMLNVSWAYKLSFRMPKFVTRAAANDSRGGKWMPFLGGGLTFFLPCGFTLIAQGIALTSGSFILGAMIMLYFAFGTLPILAGISWSGLKFTSKPHLTAKFMSVAGILILFFSLYNINGQLNVLGYPSASDLSIFVSRAEEVSSNIKYDSEGEQVISMIAKGFEYTPTSATTIKAGVPTKLVVDDQGMQGCGVFLAARGLFDGFVALEYGENVIDLGKPSPGTYKITCSMGMVRPVTVTVE